MNTIAQGQTLTQGAALLGKTATAMGRNVVLGTSGAALEFTVRTPGSFQLMVLDAQNTVVRQIATSADARGAAAGTKLEVAGIVFATAICFRLVEGDLDVTGVLQIAAMAVFNGGVTSVLTFGTFTFLGGLFGITTHLQLLELAHPNQPLLYKLAREAPGKSRGRAIDRILAGLKYFEPAARADAGLWSRVTNRTTI